MHHRSHRLRYLLLSLFVLFCLSIGSIAYADEPVAGEPTGGELETTQEPTPPLVTSLPTEEAPADDPATGTPPPPSAPTQPPPATRPPTQAPSTTGTQDDAGEPDAGSTEQAPEATGEAPTPPASGDDKPTAPDEGDAPEPEATSEPKSRRGSGGLGGMIQPLAMQTSCEMQITDGGDDNPFTFAFNAVSNNIASYAWDFGDGATAAIKSPSHTYAAAGDYPITLTCTPAAGFGTTPLVVTGSISITPVLFADFDLTPGTTFNSLPQIVTAINSSSGGTLTYDWKISKSSNPNDAGIYSATTANISYEFTTADFDTYPAVFYFHLKVTNGNETRLVTKSVAFNIVPPKADFTLSPVSGTAPLTVAVEGFALPGSGPITSWMWTFGDGTGTETGPGPHNYTYNTVSSYWITLNYEGPGGSGTVSRQVGVYPDSEPVQASFSWAAQGEVGGKYRICFTNNSTGPFETSEWDFGDGQTLTSSAAVVCHDYATTGSFNVGLRVSNTDGASSEDAQSISVVGQPVANFDINPGDTITWGDTVSFTDTSTGVVTSWAWDFDGDGVIDSTEQNPSGISLDKLGANPIRLTVTGPGGSSYVEKIVTVNRLELTCDFTGSLNVLPGAGPQTYTSAVGNIGGRTVAYNWTVTGSGTGLPMSFTTQDISVDWTSVGTGAFQVTLNASTEDGSTCNTTKTVTRDWQPLQCDMNNPLPGTLYADGESYIFTASVDATRLDGRTASYQWYVDGVAQSGATETSFTWANPTSTTGLPRNVSVGYTVTVNNGPGYTPPTSDCTETRSFTVQPWPTLTCNSISGEIVPLPTTADASTRSYTYTANIGGRAGRPVSYAWAVDGGEFVPANPSGNTATVQWDPNRAAPGHNAPENISVVVTVTNPDGTTVTCNRALGVNVSIPNMICHLPIGDVTPVVGETEHYSRNLGNVYGRNISGFSWEIEQQTSPGVWTSVALSNPTDNPLSFQFPNPNETYRVRYHATADAYGSVPANSCTSDWLNLNVWGTGVGFQCESALNGPATVTTAGPHTYTLFMNNGNGYNLEYRYTLTDWTGDSHTWTQTSTADGNISRAFSLAELGPHGVGNYTLRVTVSEVGEAHTTHTCYRELALNVGTLTANYTYNAGSWTNNAVPIGQQICFDNTSTTTPPSPLSYTWTISGNPAHNSLGASTSTDEDLSCLSFSQPGSYTIELEAESASGRTERKSVTFNVYGQQSISINRTGSAFAPSTQSFSAVGTNITGGYSWQFYRDGNSTPLGSRTGQNVSFPFDTAGKYRAVVTGTGPLGPTQAMLEFTLLAADDLAARFKASQYAGVGPLDVCFTDQSVTGGSPITLWEWDLDGDGTYELSYGPGGAPGSICHTYTGEGTKTTVSLRVTNASFTRTATNVIRVYNLAESQSSFSVTPNGAGSYCFTALIPAGVTVTGWDFGDGTTGGPADSICHNFGAAGTYLVTMKISGGEVVREVEVPENPGPAPVLSVTPVCSADRTASFTIANTGGSMATPDQATIRDLNGAIIYTGPFRLDAGQSITISVSNMSGRVTFESIDFSLSAETTCNYPPELSIAATCVGNLPVFTITNARPTDGPMAAPQNYEIRDSQGGLVHSSTFQLTAGQTSVNIPVPADSNPYETYTFTSSGASGNLSLTHQCATPPNLTVTSTCANPIEFTVTNSGGGMVQGQAYSVVNGSGTTVASGNLNLAAGASTIITLTGLDPYAGYTFNTTGFAGDETQTQNCARPALTVTSQCANPIAFTVTNNGGAMLLDQAYTIAGGSSPITGNLNLAAGASTIITLTGLDPYAGYTFSTSGWAGSPTLTQDCDQPDLEISSQCAETIVFNVKNNSGAMLVDQAYTVVNGSGETVASGMFNLAVDGSTTVSLDGLDPYAGYTLSSSGFAGSYSYTQNCTRPALIPTTQCAADVIFSVTNDGGPMLMSQPYTVVDASGATLVSGSFNFGAGDSTTITVPGANPYQTYTLKTGGFASTFDSAYQCEAPALRISTSCDAPARFIITNVGGDMQMAHPYSLFSNGVNVTPAGAEFRLLKGQSLRVNEPGVDMAQGLRFTTDYLGIRAEGRFSCEAYTEIVALPTLTPTPGLMSTPVAPRPGSGGGFGGLAPEALELDWNATRMCGYGCPPFRVYHTNEPDNWNIFRLDGADQEARESFRRNLSFGTGPDVRDVSPSLSPNSQWVIFSSNRDGNWELYVASTSGDPASVHRVTYNTVAIDTDPAWGPNNFVAFETTRNGQWDIYLIDMSTGIEYRLTDDSGNDINPYWSPDGSRLLFQSDRPDENGVRQWQVYQITLGSKTVTRLSDGTSVDVDPQFSNDGRKIVYRTYAEDSANSIIMLMDADGRNKRAITSPDEDATNPSWSPRDRYIAYQSDLDGDLDIYVYEVATEQTRHLTDNDIPDYAPTWDCSEEIVIFTSDIEGDPDIYEAPVQPITAGPIKVEDDATQLTFETFDDIYPLSFPVEENASREGQTVRGSFGEQTSFLEPDASLTRIDPSLNRERRDDWPRINGCAGR